MVLLSMQVIAAPYRGTVLLATVVASLSPAILFGAAFALLLNNRASFSLLYPILGNRLMAPAAGIVLLGFLQLDAPVDRHPLRDGVACGQRVRQGGHGSSPCPQTGDPSR